MQLRVGQLKPGMIVYFNGASQKDKDKKYKKAEILEMYKYFCTVRVFPLSGDEKDSYIETLGYTSIGCGDIVVKDSINEKDLATRDDIALELAG